MGKRAPIKTNESGYAYVFLSDPGIVLKIYCTVDDHVWRGNSLNLRMKSKSVAVASYSGKRNMAYFPGANKTRSLLNFGCDFENGGFMYIDIDVEGVTSLHNPEIPKDFDNNVSTLSMLRYMRIPPPVSISVSWTHSDYTTKQSKYSCYLKCVEGDRRTSYRKQTEFDKIMESLL